MVTDMKRLGILFIGLLWASISATVSAEETSVRTDIFYGVDPNRPERDLQTLDVFYQAEASNQPVIIYIHGGGWAFGDKNEVNHKPDYFVPNGFAFISMNYRLRWDYELFHQLEDVVSVVSWVHENAGAYGLDASRIVLMGNGAGGHLASLVGTDERHLKGGGFDLGVISAVVSINSMSYDIPRVHRELGSFVERRQHRLVFGEDETVQEQASPIHHVKPERDLPAFALLFVSDEESSKLQTEGFAKALMEAEASVIMIPGNTKTKRSINVELGAEGDRPTLALMAFLRAST
jgi:acetyl esterase/lipase